MDKKNQPYITDEEKVNCQKVADAFAELFKNEDIIVLNADTYGFVKLQCFRFPFGFEDFDIFYDCKSLFDDLWNEWYHTELINIASGTPMEEMEYEDIFKCLPPEKQKEILNMRLHFAEKTGIEDILEKCKPDLWSEEFMNARKTWSRDWENYDWEQVIKKLSEVKKERQEGKTIDKPDIGITIDELKEYLEWLYIKQPEFYLKFLTFFVLVKAGISLEKAERLAHHPEELKDLLEDFSFGTE